MKVRIRQYFNSLQPLTDEEWAVMDECFELVSFKKGEVLLVEGEVCNFIGFIVEGSIRFYQLKEGNEKVTAFWFPGDFLSNYRSFVANQPSAHFIECLADGSFWRLRKAHLEKLYDTFPNIDRLGRKMAERLYLMVTHRLDHLLSETPEERYKAMQEKNSRLLHEIPQYMIASYLGVSAETLSRIRKRIHSK